MPPTLLVADDSVTIQRVIELTFAGEAVDVVAVGDGEQAIACIEAAPPDIVLADVDMPKKDGYEVAEYVKRSPRLAHIPVVLLTGAFEPVDQERAASAGCDGILAKPFEPQQVIARVKELLAGGAAPAAQASPWPRPAAEPATGGPSDRPALDAYFQELDGALAARSAAEQPPQAAKDDGETRRNESVVSGPPASKESGRALPSLADAFAAILDAERRAQPHAAAAVWPSSGGSGALDEKTLDAIADQIIRRLSTDMTRQMVADIVSEIAERLVREEIERIKSAIE